MAQYSFVTTWKIEAPIEQVWEAIYNSERWPVWWRGVERVEELEPGDKNGLGALQRYTWKSKLPYRLVFSMRLTHVQEPYSIEGTAQGELVGTGRWQLTQSDGGRATIIRYYWDVSTTKAWMNSLAPVARPFFKWNHDIVMAWGAEGLSRLLNARLL